MLSIGETPSDADIMRYTADSMGIDVEKLPAWVPHPDGGTVYIQQWNPLENDYQVMMMIKKWNLRIGGDTYSKPPTWLVEHHQMHSARHINLNRAVCEAVSTF